jgi:hypothetical protein
VVDDEVPLAAIRRSCAAGGSEPNSASGASDRWPCRPSLPLATVAAVLFMTAAVLLVTGGRWQAVAASAAVSSLAVLAASASVAVAGLVVDVAMLLVVLGTRGLRRRSSGDAT